MNQNDTDPTNYDPTTDYDSIKYVCDEMEPTERLAFERRMHGDTNLKIEVVSLQTTHGRLSDLPDVTPPRDLVNSVVQMACPKGANGFSFSYTLMAAMMLVTFSAGYILMDQDNRMKFFGSTGTSQVQTDGVAKSATTGLPEMQPWVDYNEVLYLDESSASSTQQDSILRQMQPMRESIPGNVRERFFNSDVVLTGSAN